MEIRDIAKTAKPLESIHLYRSSLEGYRFGRGRQNCAVICRRVRKRRLNRRSRRPGKRFGRGRLKNRNLVRTAHILLRD